MLDVDKQKNTKKLMTSIQNPLVINQYIFFFLEKRKKRTEKPGKMS